MIPVQVCTRMAQKCLTFLGGNLAQEKRLTFKQKSDIVIEVAEHIHTLAKLTSEKLPSADKKWIIENFLSVQPEIRVGFSKTKSRRSTFHKPSQSRRKPRVSGARSRISLSFAATT